MGTTLAFDLGGTRLKAGVVEPASRTVLATATAPVAGLAFDAVLPVMREVGRELAAGVPDPPGAVALAVPGIVDADRVEVLPGKFPGIVGHDLAGWLREAFAVSAVVVENDAVAYGLGEVAALDDRSGRVVVVTLGTGVGCTVLQDGLPILDGPYGRGTLGGQLPVGDPVGPLDTAGRPGTFEARCRAGRLLGEARDAGCAADDVPAVLAAAAAGDPAARRGLATYRGWLVRGLMAVTHAYTPRLAIVGGGPLATPSGAAVVLEGVEEDLAAVVWEGCAPEVRAAAAGDHAALLGLAVLVTARSS